MIPYVYEHHNSLHTTNIPKKDPNAELNIANASLPPTALVNITAEDTGGGIHLDGLSAVTT